MCLLLKVEIVLDCLHCSLDTKKKLQPIESTFNFIRYLSLSPLAPSPPSPRSSSNQKKSLNFKNFKVITQFSATLFHSLACWAKNWICLQRKFLNVTTKVPSEVLHFVCARTWNWNVAKNVNKTYMFVISAFSFIWQICVYA